MKQEDRGVIMKIKLHLYEDMKKIPSIVRHSPDFNYDEVSTLGVIEIDDDKDIMSHPLCYQDKIYIICSFTPLKGEYHHAHLEPLTEFNPDVRPEHETHGDNLICPVCGHKEEDSWELPDSDDEYECGTCGSTLSYQRNVSVTYSTTVIEVNQPINV